MRWTIVLQCEDGAGNLSTTDVQTLERAVDPAFSTLGLLHREGKRLLLRLQQQFVRQKAAAYCAHIRPCRKCGINRSIKTPVLGHCERSSATSWSGFRGSTGALASTFP